MAPACAKLDSQEMMLPGLFSHPLLDVLATRYLKIANIKEKIKTCTYLINNKYSTFIKK
jgi:hypothetical protein